MKLGIFHFQLLYDILADLHYIYDEEELAKYILSKVSDALNSEGGTIFQLQDEETLYPLASYGVSVEKLRQVNFNVKKGVVGWVIQYMQPVKVDNPDKDPRFMGGVDKNTSFRTKSIIAAPIISKNKPLGVLEFLNRRDGPFAIGDMELISMIGREIGIAFENIRMIKEIANVRALQKSVMDSLSAGLIVFDTNGNLLNINPRAKEILHVDDKSVQGKVSVQNLFAHYPPLVKVFEEIMSSDQLFKRLEINLEVNHKTKNIGYSGIPVIDNHDNRVGSAFLFQDLTDLNVAK